MPRYITRHPSIPQDAFPLNYGDILAQDYLHEHVSFQEIIDLYTQKKLIFWHLYDIYFTLPEEDVAMKQWIEQHISSLARTSDECIRILMDISYTSEDKASIEKKAQDYASLTQDFLDLADIHLFRASDMEKFLKSATTMEDRIDILNFLSLDPKYAALHATYKEDMIHHINSLEDFKELYMYSNDTELQVKAKLAIEHLIQIKL